MDKNEILLEVQSVFRIVLENENLLLTRDTTADDVEDWDSLTHVLLVKEVEKHFGIRFTSREILSWKNVGEMVDSIEAKKV